MQHMNPNYRSYLRSCFTDTRRQPNDQRHRQPEQLRRQYPILIYHTYANVQAGEREESAENSRPL